MVSQPKRFRTPLVSQGSFESSFDLAEWTAIGTSVGGSVLGILLQQGIVAISSLYLGLSFLNRHRTEQKIEQQANYIQQLKEYQKQTATCSEVKGLQKQIEVANSNTNQQLQSLQTLQQGINSLQDSPVNWEQLQSQVENLQTTLNTYLSNSTPSTTTPVEGRGRVAIFIDHGNLEHTAKFLGIKIDYESLLKQLQQDAPLAGAWLHIAVNTKYSRQNSFLNALTDKGYQIVQKDKITRNDGSCKGDIDVELALNLITLGYQDQYDTAVLVSGDGDFTCAVEQVQAQGKKVEVVSISNHTSNKLKDVANRYISLKDIQNKISC